MEDWTEESLIKLSVKELKSLARKSNVNTNFKKAELVKALAGVKDIADCHENGKAQTSRRITRSRVSLWQAFDKESDHLPESKAKFENEAIKLKSELKESSDNSSIKRKKVKTVNIDNAIDAYDTSEMFPLVSSIQLASKSSVKITDKDIVRLEHDKQEEFTVTSKRSKRNNAKNINIEDAGSSKNTEVNEIASVKNICVIYERNEQKNNTFIRKGKRSISQNVNKENKIRKQVNQKQVNEEPNIHSPEQLPEQLKIFNTSELNKENEQDLNILSAAECSSEKPKQGKKRKFESAVGDKVSVENTVDGHESLGTDDYVAKDQNSIKNRRKKGKASNEIKLVNTQIQHIENSPVKDVQEINDMVLETFSSKIGQDKKQAILNETKLDDSKKRKLRNSLLVENSNNNSDSSISETKNKNNSKSKKSSQSPKTNVLSSTEIAKDEEQKMGKNKQALPLKDESSKKGEDKDISAVQGDNGEKEIQGPTRSSTFILSESGVTGGSEEKLMPVPTRNTTFILSDTGSTLKKSTATGSVSKKGTASKMPKFKKIHQQLFKKMESLSEYKKRQKDRAKGLLLSPAVPRCALLTPRPANTRNVKLSPNQKDRNTKMRTQVAPSPLATKLKTPVASRTPAPRTPVVSRTPVAARTANPVSSSVNRFGYRNPVRKEEAINIVKRTYPSLNLEKKKEQGRSILEGVRKNKRFMLQMQMRQLDKEREKGGNFSKPSKA